jgi:hypothetical protein
VRAHRFFVEELDEVLDERTEYVLEAVERMCSQIKVASGVGWRIGSSRDATFRPNLAV